MSGGVDGVVAISSPATGLTVRLIQDHKGAPITDMDIEKVSVCSSYHSWDQGFVFPLTINPLIV